jgi:organic radical activating enzyme
VDAPLLAALRAANFKIAVETNGTKPLPGHIDWVCVSPKARTKLVLTEADELKLVYPQQGIKPEQFSDFPALHRWLSPRDSRDHLAEHTRAAAAYCLANPLWKLAIQAHKHWKIP